MVTIFVTIVLIPYRDLVLEIIFSIHSYCPPLHFPNMIRRFLVQIQGGQCTRRLKLGIEGASLLEPVELPDAETDTDGGPCEDKQRKDQPPALEHLKQEHFLFSLV